MSTNLSQINDKVKSAYEWTALLKQEIGKEIPCGQTTDRDSRKRPRAA